MRLVVTTDVTRSSVKLPLAAPDDSTFAGGGTAVGNTEVGGGGDVSEPNKDACAAAKPLTGRVDADTIADVVVETTGVETVSIVVSFVALVAAGGRSVQSPPANSPFPYIGIPLR
jgi:hypothetical protein